VLRTPLFLAVFGTGVIPAVAQAPSSDATASPMATTSHMESLARELAELDAEIAGRRERPGEPLDSGLAARARTLHDEAIYLKVKSEKYVAAGGEGTGVGAVEVSSLREAIAKLRDDILLSTPAPPVTSAPGGADEPALEELPADTVFSAKLLDPLSSETAEVGDRFEAVTLVPVTIGGKTVIPQGSAVFGAVESVDRAGRADRSARLVLAFDRLDIDAESQVITATVVGASRDLETGIGKEKKKMGLGAGVGGVIGAVLGGGTGAIAGAILGGTGAILGTEGKNVELPRGTMLQLRVDRPLRLRARPPAAHTPGGDSEKGNS
jgi:hypothetical protein